MEQGENQPSKREVKKQTYDKKYKTNEKSDIHFSLDKWLKKHGIAVARTKEVENGICYVLSECPWNHEHSRDKGAYIIQYDSGNIVAGCHHDSCREQGADWKSLWKMMEGDAPLPNVQRNKKNKQDLRKESQADVLLKMLEERGHECFKNFKNDVFVQVREDGKIVNYSLKSEAYQELVIGIYYKETKRSIRKDMVSQVIDTLSAKAIVLGDVYETHKRFAMHQGKLYYYLADSENTVLCISEDGIMPCKESPVRMIKNRYMLAQPMPLQGKDFSEVMRRHYRFASKEDEILHNVILVTRLIANIEQPIVIYTGPKGSYKTTSMDKDKRILDYSSSNITMMPKNEEDLLLVLNSQDIICFDNIDSIGKTKADIFCQILSGSVALKRKKYTDSELCEVSLKSTVYMTGINLLSGRTDFLSRCIFINTRASSNDKSKLQLMEEFEKDKPYILYGVFDVLSKAIKIHDGLGSIPYNDRLIDFVKWGYAVAEAIGYGGEQFLKAYKKNRRGIDEEALADDEVANAVMLYLEEYDSFTGSMTQLSKKLTSILSDDDCSVSGKIKSANLLSRRLGELESELKRVGINVEIGRKSGKRYVTLRKDINRTIVDDKSTKRKKKVS